jgi:hypothetical protein
MDETKGTTTPQRKSKGERKRERETKKPKYKTKRRNIYSLQEVMEKRLKEIWKLWNEYLNMHLKQQEDRK